LAIALAAQKTIENFFGGVSVVTDRPVLVGDFCKFGGQVGTVEDIGLRSTRIRTLDRTLVTIPNSQFSTMTLENYSRRDRMWFHPTLHLRRGTSADQVSAFMETILEILKSDPMISIGDVPLRFTEIKEQSLQIEVFAYILSDSYDRFLEYQTKLLLEILRAAEHKGIAFALPITESINSNALS
jgi:MscS family membrane protein